MGEGQAPGRRKLTVTKCDFGRSGTAANGNEWTMYDVACRGEDGQPIDKQFNSFEPLPLGELVEYEITHRDHERYGRTYTLKRPGNRGGGGGGGGLGKSVDDIRGRVERLEGQVTSIINGAQPIGGAGGASGSAPPAGAPPAPPATPPATPPAAPPGGSADDDIPF